MSIKNEALRLIDELPDGCTWVDVLRTVAAGAGGSLQWPPAGAQEETAALRCDFDVVVERDAAGWYVGSMPMPHTCDAGPGSVEELMGRVREAVEVCLESAGFRPINPNVRKMN